VEPRGQLTLRFVLDEFDQRSRVAFGIYNFSDDLGTASHNISSADTHAMEVRPLWPAALGIAVALAVALLLPESDRTHRSETSKERPRYADKSRGGFSLLFAICVLDSAVRMGFLPFLLEAKGTSLPEIGFALALVFIGGAAGKFACGWLGARLGAAILTLPLIRR
jgi:hypothetical protein